MRGVGLPAAICLQVVQLHVQQRIFALLTFQIALTLLLWCRYLFLGMEQAAEVVNAALQQLLTNTHPAATSAAARAAAAMLQSPDSSSSSSSSSIWAWLHRTNSSVEDATRHQGFRSLLQGFAQGLVKQQGLLQALLKSAIQWCRAAATATPTIGTPVQANADSPVVGEVAAAAAKLAAHSLPADIKLMQCPLLNVSICLASVSGTGAAAAASSASTTAARHLQMAAAAGAAPAGRIAEEGVTDNSSSSSGSEAAAGGLLVVVYNSLAWPRREWVRVPVAAVQDASYTLQGAQHA
jgi:hypothetical protein